MLIGAGGAAAFFNRDALLGAFAPRPSSAPPPPKAPIGPAIASGRAAVSIANGGSVSLPSGARADVAPGALSADTELVLARVATPPSMDPRSRLIGNDAYHLATTKHAVPDGDVSLALPIPASVTKLDSVTAYAFNGRTLYPARSRVDVARRLVIVANPSVTELSAPASYRPLRQEEDGGGGLLNLLGDDDGKQGGLGLSAGPATTTNRPVVIYQVGYAPPAPPGVCVTGTLGETLEKPNHAFTIVFETNASCALANVVSDYLQEAYEVYARDYRSTDGKPPLRQFTPSKRMEVFLAPLEGGVNGEYEFRSWNGYIAVDPFKAERSTDLTSEAARRRQALRNTLYHELFHAVQNRYRNLLVQAANGARWWIEATAERAAQRVRRIDFDAAIREGFGEYGAQVASVPLENSGSIGALSYGDAMVVAHVEKAAPSYIRDTLNSFTILSNGYFLSMVTAGNLETTYDDFARELLARAPTLVPSPWVRGRIVEAEAETRALRLIAPDDYGSTAETPTRITDKAARAKPQRFRFKAGPMTTSFMTVQALMKFKPTKTVEVTPMITASHPSMIGVGQGFATTASEPKTQGPVPVRSLPIGTKTAIPGLGDGYQTLWLAFANMQRTDLTFDIDIAIKSDVEEVQGEFQPGDPSRVIAGMPPMRKASSVLEGRMDAPGKTWTIEVGRAPSAQAAKEAMSNYEKTSKANFPARWASANTPTRRDNSAQTCTPANECSYAPDLMIDALSSVCVRKSTSTGTSGTGSDGMLDMQALYRDVWLIKMRLIASSTEPKLPWPKGSAAATAKEIVDNAKKLIDERFGPAP